MFRLVKDSGIKGLSGSRGYMGIMYRLCRDYVASM